MKEKRYLCDVMDDDKNLKKCIKIFLKISIILFVIATIGIVVYLHLTTETTNQEAKERYELAVEDEKKVLSECVKEGEWIDAENVKKLQEMTLKSEIHIYEDKVTLKYTSMNNYETEIILDLNFRFIEDNLFDTYSSELVSWRNYVMNIAFVAFLTILIMALMALGYICVSVFASIYKDIDMAIKRKRARKNA